LSAANLNLILKGLAEVKTWGLAEVKTRGLAEVKTRGLAEVKTRGLAEVKTWGLAEVKTRGLAEVKTLSIRLCISRFQILFPVVRNFPEYPQLVLKVITNNLET
jgi:hypothetical protein